MKVFRYPLGHKAGETMTVAELISSLADYPKDMPVMAEWEGVQAYIRKEDFTIETADKWRSDEACDCLLINVNEY